MNTYVNTPRSSETDEFGYPICHVALKCSRCHTTCSKGHHLHGEACEAARKEGWKTVPGPKTSDPMDWICNHCVSA
jgi:hypothetical protein